MRHVQTVRCTHVVAQVSLGYYDKDGNLVGEEAFPQADGNLLTAKLFHPHAEQLENLIGMCIEQAWAKLHAQDPSRLPAEGRNGAEPGQRGVSANALDRAPAEPAE